VLVVDDEKIVCDLVVSMLARLGYEARAAVGGADAVEVFRQAGARFDLVVIDMVMPGMDGYDCFRELKRIDPDVRAVLSSGYGPNGRAQTILDQGMVGFVQKPYCLADLATAVAAALGTAAPTRTSGEDSSRQA